LCTDGRPTQSDDKGSHDPLGSGELKKKKRGAYYFLSVEKSKKNHGFNNGTFSEFNTPSRSPEENFGGMVLGDPLPKLRPPVPTSNQHGPCY
jgi:hypothetical protein